MTCCLKLKSYTAWVLVDCRNLSHSHKDSCFHVAKFLLPFIKCIKTSHKMQNICIRAIHSVHALCKFIAKCILDIQNEIYFNTNWYRPQSTQSLYKALFLLQPRKKLIMYQGTRGWVKMMRLKLTWGETNHTFHTVWVSHALEISYFSKDWLFYFCLTVMTVSSLLLKNRCEINWISLSFLSLCSLGILKPYPHWTFWSIRNEAIWFLSIVSLFFL